MVILRAAATLLLALTASAGSIGIEPAWGAAEESCPRPAPGAAIAEPRDLRSDHGVLTVDLTIRSQEEPDGSVRYCYLLPDGSQSPTLRLHPGDLLTLRLTNQLTAPTMSGEDAVMNHPKPRAGSDPCTSGAMTATSTNLHFHGLTVPPLCHQDDVLNTFIQPSDGAFEYRFRIPSGEPPGLYWYHPHVHGFSSKEVMGGASGALIIEGIERAIPEVAGLAERVLVIRDQDLLNPAAPPSRSEPVVPKMMIDRDGDSANNGTGFGKPAKDLSINYVPVPYPDYPPASLTMRPGERQLWRVLNASAITYLNLAVLWQRTPQQVGIVAIDGVPTALDQSGARPLTWVNHIGVPPGARVEFIVTAPPAGVPALLVTRTVDTGQGGENDPNRALASIMSVSDAAETQSRLPAEHAPLPSPRVPTLDQVLPTRVRKLYFSEKLDDPGNPNSASTFYLTVEGQTPAPFDPRSGIPNIIANQGDVEDWIIENRSTELHAFHIHQIHFKVMQWDGLPIDEPFLRDTVNVPYFNGRTLQYPSVRLRMDFRDPSTIGTFVYHCHLLEHEDAGMMGTIRVDPPRVATQTRHRAGGH
jgi:FtsP/CotA-like multicopper oxidase with cupredoxin domain